jgi:serine/threonine protein kinase
MDRPEETVRVVLQGQPPPLTKLCEACGFRLEATLFRCPVDGATLPAERADVTVLGPYRLIERLGTGGMGVVYRAIHAKLGRMVAIKMLHRSLLADKTTLARFFQEARSVNTIRHPNVVEVYDFVTAGTDVYMVMEFLIGRDLHTALEQSPGRRLSPLRTVQLLEQICAALQAAHLANIVHRDLKPANIFLCQQRQGDESVKLLDFGLAKWVRGEGKMTKDGVVLGTVEYMAPEQARGDKLDGRADLYAVGCIAYEMLTGRRVFTGGNFADIMLRHVREAPTPPRKWSPDIPPALDDLVMRCLAKRPDERPQSAHELAQQLLDVGRQLDPGHVGTFDQRTQVVGRPSMPTLGAIVRTSQGSQGGGSGRPSRTLAITAASSVAAAVLGIVLWASGAGSPSGYRAVVHSTGSAGVTAGPQPIAVKLDSTPKGAEIWKDGTTMIGLTPVDLLVAPGSRHRLRFSREGFDSVERVFHVTASTTIAVTLRPAAGAAGAPQEKDRNGEKAQDKQADPKGRATPGGEGKRTRTLNPFGA